MAARPGEIAGALHYYLCFCSTPAGPNGICLHLNNSSITLPVRNAPSERRCRYSRALLKDGISAR